ncbi:unnamed protein product [Rotaria socialis]|uniref:Uncharacterized protein n=2 Tax=Rotaria socialis TaxID=392032 RepID=A0A821FCI4_9BILA|nr:unnamed protein product [Rotaria socialis]
MYNRVHIYVPYCFRTMNISIANPIQGESFASMYEQNRTTEELLFQHASLDTIEDYEIYSLNRRLNRSNPISGEQLYQRCGPSTFGDTCQYRFLLNGRFLQIVHDTFYWKRFHHPRNILMITTGTCYRELQCEGSVVCLDWREVCDGYVQCPNGEDEEHCHQLEINECDALTEYRCKNGHCIPQEMLLDRIPDCLDKSDEIHGINEFCHGYMDWYCDNSICDSYLNHHIYGTPMAFTCGDGQCREMSNVDIIRPAAGASALICGSGRDILYTQQLFLSNNDCFEHIKCTLKFSFFQQECKIKCTSQYQCSSRIPTVCGNLSYAIFPTKPVFDNHVFFVYKLNPMTLSMTNYIPSLICFDSKKCSHYQTTINVDGKTCSTVDQLKEFRDLGRSLSWIGIHTALYTVFGRCASSGTNDEFRLISYNFSSCGHSSLFHCTNSSRCISRHRIQDGSIDCYTGDDEIANYMCDQLPHRFSCNIDQRCIPRRFLMDYEKQCTDGSDEAFGFQCTESLSENCDTLAGRRDTAKENAFSIICNGIQEIRPKFEADDTDETDCTEYSCMTQYTLCNGVWNCVDGRDEIFCDNALSSMHCDVKSGEFFCLQSINHTIRYCASVKTINDSQIDCIGSSDERDFCRKQYPFDFTRRYRCKNASICISPLQICDCHRDCPLNDDEELPLCPWNIASCSTRFFPCSNSVSGQGEIINIIYRCDGLVHCNNHEDEWLCDIIDQSETRTFTSKNLLDFVPILPKNTKNELSQNVTLSWYCNRGIAVSSTVRENEIKCLCPSAYYGDRCEYQRKRLNVILELQATTLIVHASVFKLLIFLVQISTGYVTYSAELIYLPFVQCLPKYIVDLLYPVSWQIKDQHYIRISIFHLTQQSKQIDYRGSWFFAIEFEFLPVNRLVSKITLTENSNPNILRKCTHLSCVHGRCESYLNEPQHYFCQCEPSWFGRLCDLQNAEKCNCAPESICIAPEICICPLNKIGSRCYVPFDPCQVQPCGKNGICVPSDVRSNQWTCVCDEQFFGERCQYNASSINVHFAQNIRIPGAILIHFISLSNINEKKVHSYFRSIGLWQNDAIVFYPEKSMPNLVFVQLFGDLNTNPLHLVFLNNEDTVILYNRIHVEVSKNNECPAISNIFGSTFDQLPYLRRVKQYQRPCKNTTTRITCFYDETHICLCNKLEKVDCIPFVIDNSTAQCPINTNPCKNGGICMQDENQCPKASICVCPECSHGRLCQFSAKPYSLSLEGIIGQFIKSNVKFYQQPHCIFMSLTIASAIFTLGCIDTILCLITFSQSSLRSTGRGFYLLCLSLVCLVNISACFAQMLRLLIEQTSSFSSYPGCIITHFILKAFPIMINWIQVCASIENVAIVCFGLRYRKELSYHAAKYVIGLILLLSFMMTIHDSFYRHLLYDEFEHRTWCVVSFPSKWLKWYDSFMTTIHYVAPFSINILCSIAIIILTARIRARANHSYKKTFWKNLKQNKHLLISPILLALFAIPKQTIALLTTCMKFNGRSEPYFIIIVFYVGYLPSILSTVVFIFPSKTYREQLWQALQHLIRPCRISRLS